MITKSFESWTTEELEDTFGLKRNNNLASFQVWLQEKYDIPEAHKEEILALQTQL